jgi:hypothetical protein
MSWLRALLAGFAPPDTRYSSACQQQVFKFSRHKGHTWFYNNSLAVATSGAWLHVSSKAMPRSHGTLTCHAGQTLQGFHSRSVRSMAWLQVMDLLSRTRCFEQHSSASNSQAPPGGHSSGAKRTLSNRTEVSSPAIVKTGQGASG